MRTGVIPAHCTSDQDAALSTQYLSTPPSHLVGGLAPVAGEKDLALGGSDYYFLQEEEV